MRIQVQSKVFIIGPNDTLLLLKRGSDAPTRPGEWEIVGGHVEDGEYMAEAAARETFEETGITIDSQEIELVYALTERPADDLSVTWLFYRAETVRTQIELSHEHTEYKWVSADEALQLITYERQHRALRYLHENDMLHARHEDE